MLIGRVVGRMLLAVAVVLASGDVVLAFGPGEHAGIATGEVVTLLSGHPTPEGLIPGIAGLRALISFLLELPAWAVIGPIGAAICWLCRRRPKRYRFRPG